MLVHFSLQTACSQLWVYVPAVNLTCCGLCRNAVKGINLLIKAGVLEARPEAVAQFLKEQGSALAPSAVGEYLGHQDDLPVII